MHDPDTVAFDLKYPWFTHWPHWRWVPASWRSPHWKDGYRETWLTVWHHDPSDYDSIVCGWHSPPYTDRDKAFARELAEWEEKFPYYFAQHVVGSDRVYEDGDGQLRAYRATRIGAGDCVALLADLFVKLRWQLDPDRRRWGLTPALLREAFRVGAADGDNLQASFAFDADDARSESRRREKMIRTFLLVIRAYRRATRPWWQHPRWHVHHWRLQVHPVQAFKRWAFSRCRYCGKGFRRNEGVIGYAWHGTGPRWFRSEDIAHPDCDAAHRGAGQTPTEARV